MKIQLEAYAEERLHLLCQLDPEREWHSLDETRHCILCEQTISGHDIRIVKKRQTNALRCPTPGCVGTPREWVHPGNPLTSEDAWRDWVRLLDTLCDEENTGRRPIRRLHPESSGSPASLKSLERSGIAACAGR